MVMLTRMRTNRVRVGDRVRARVGVGRAGNAEQGYG